MSPCASPFNHSKADVILLSSDGTSFRVFKLFLILASPFFETMFNLPQPPDTECDLPIIPVQEDDRTLDLILRFCYPSTVAEDPSLESPTDILAVLKAAKKYSLDLVERRACQALVDPKLLDAHPFSHFAIAKNANLRLETIIAARYSLKQPLIPPSFPEIDIIAASDLLALLAYHQKCSIAIENLRHKLDWVQSHYHTIDNCSWLFPDIYKDNNCSCCEGNTTLRYFLWGQIPFVWWGDYMERTFELLKDAPCGDTVRANAKKAIIEIKLWVCEACFAQAKAGMKSFISFFALTVDAIIGSVELEIDF